MQVKTIRRRRKRFRSSGENKIVQVLLLNNIEFSREFSFADCINPKTRHRLRFDFYLPQYNILVEFQGPHHYKPVNKKYSALRAHLKTIDHDKIKREYCYNHSIKLIAISYLDYAFIEVLLLTEVNLKEN